MAQARFVVQPPLAAPRSIVRAALAPATRCRHGGEREPDLGLAIGAAWRACVQREPSTMPAPHTWHTLTRLADGRLLMLGGPHRGELAGGARLFD